MTHRRRRFASAIVALFLSVFIARTAAAAGEVPIRGTVSGTVTATRLGEEGSRYRLDNIGSGTCSHLGRIEATWAVPEVELNLAERTITISDLEWDGTLRAANGDEIFGRYRFSSQAIPFSLAGEIVFDVDLTVTGGTGRFEGATGQARTSGRANIFTRTFRIEMAGEMSTVGSTGGR